MSHGNDYFVCVPACVCKGHFRVQSISLLCIFRFSKKKKMHKIQVSEHDDVFRASHTAGAKEKATVHTGHFHVRPITLSRCDFKIILAKMTIIP